MDNNTTDTTKLPANVTETMMAEWKAKSKKGIATISSGDYTAFIRRPTRDDMRELNTRSQGIDRITYTEIVLDQLWLGGDEEIRTDDGIFYGVMDVVAEVLDYQEATLKKL